MVANAMLTYGKRLCFLMLTKNKKRCTKLEMFLPLDLLNLSGLVAGPIGEWTESLPVVCSQDEASESPPSRSTLHWSSYMRIDGRANCFLKV